MRPPASVATGMLEAVRLWRDRPLRVRLTEAGLTVLEGHLEQAIAELAEIERHARSDVVRRWANEGRVAALLIGDRVDEAQVVADPRAAGTPLIAALLSLTRGTHAPELVEGLRSCTDAVRAMAAARTIQRSAQLEEVSGRLGSVGGETAVNALLALQMGFHYLREYDTAIAIGEDLVGKGAGVDVVAYFLAVDSAAIGDDRAALAWLSHAVDQGFAAGLTLDRDPRLDRVRSQPGYEPLRRRIAARRDRSPDSRPGAILYVGDRATTPGSIEPES